MDRNAACLYLVVSHFDKNTNAIDFVRASGMGEGNHSLRDVSRAAEKIGLRSRCIRLTLNQLLKDVPHPCIIQNATGSLTVFLRYSKWNGRKKIICHDPEKGVQHFTVAEFLEYWGPNAENGGSATGMVLMLERTFRFYANRDNKEEKLNWGLVFRYLLNSHWYIARLVISLLVTSALQLVFPFLMQSIVDVGITTGSLSFITLVLMAQLMLVCSRLSVDLIRARILIHISTILNRSILSDFWIKLTRLPLSWFAPHRTGNILQNINDNSQVQTFLTGPALNTLYSALNFIVFAIVLMMFKVELFLIYVVGVTLYFFWMRLFFRLRRKVNYQLFHASSQENNLTLQMVQGMQEIRLQNAEQERRWEWEGLKAHIFKLHFANLRYIQLQQTGSMLINQSKDIVLTFLVAKLVIEGQLTLGAMLAVQYIIGQLSGPVEQFIGFMQNAQDAKMSMERLNQVHQLEDEEKPGREYLRQLPARRTISFQNVTFAYPESGQEQILKNIDLEIPEGKTTAIVGVSGSGKTTLLKLLLKFHESYDGQIRVGNTDLHDMSASFWRANCGAVLQDSYIFNDTIARNITGGTSEPDFKKMREACRIANVLDFVDSLPERLQARIGLNGVGISQGQKQRILIARAVYKNPAFMFLDESTNALDAENENCILENLQPFLRNKTVVVVAHRLSTVINADKIIVLHKGRVIEEGDHYELSLLKGEYFRMVRNQLELGI